ncbi:MAG TPA: DNA polymerase III subunit gamma/tau [Acidimicrobiales bacterium]
MAYQSLYRRYRPRRFSEVRGQPDVVRALRNSVREQRVGHAYLFSGPRGTGKTSTARILAKALNCTNLQEGEPCCVCDSCVAIEAGTSYDLQELDAASNNGVDAMRDLIGKAALGSPGRTKVYILDEVHMLSTAASNALLKTLEETPEHVVFVLATTDPHKVLPTIRSRTQHFEFNLLPLDELAEHVQWVIHDAGLDADAEAVDYVLKVGGGSARDTLSALDQVVAAGGVLDRGDQVDALLDAMVAADTGAALQAVADAVRRGRDPRVLGEALLASLRDVFLKRMGDPLEHLPEAQRTLVEGWAGQLTDRSCTRALEAVGDALRDMRQAPDQRIPLEVALVRLTRADTDTSLEGLAARLDRLERAVAAGGVAAAPAPTPAGAAPAAAPAPAPAPEAEATRADPDPAPAPEAEAPKSGGRGRPGDAARAQLGDRSGPAPAPPRSAGRTHRAAPLPATPSAPAPPGAPGPTAAPPERPAPAPAPEAEAPAAAPAPAPAPAAAGDAPPDRDTLTLAWGDVVLPGMRGMAKALYSAGRFLDSTPTNAVFALENEVHRKKCEEKRPEVEAALERHFGRPVPLRLVVDEGAAPARRAAEATPTPGEQRATDEAADVQLASEIGNVHDLDDAPADNRSHVDRLAEAFPGSEIVPPD